MHREATAAKAPVIVKELPKLRQNMGIFCNKDERNANKFGLYFCQTPGWLLASTPVQGIKKEKARLTFLACCSVDGSEKFQFIVIRWFCEPRPFSN